jgi:hypothetical protein
MDKGSRESVLGISEQGSEARKQETRNKEKDKMRNGGRLAWAGAVDKAICYKKSSYKRLRGRR